MVISNSFVAESLANWVGSGKCLDPIVDRNKIVSMIRCGDCIYFAFGILAEGRNIRKEVKGNNVTVGFNKSVNSFDLI